jgi:starch-binding outer membrane protein, SusD/RagB family
MALNAAKYVVENKESLGVKLYNTYDEIWRADNNKSNTEYLAVVSHSSNSTYNPQASNPNRLHLYFAPKLTGRVGIKTTETTWEYPKEANMLMPTKYFLNLFKEGDGRYDIIFQEAFLANSDFTWTESSGDLAFYLKTFSKIAKKTVSVGDTALYFTRRQIPQEMKDKASYAVVDVDMLYDADGKITMANSQLNYSFPRFQKYRIYDPNSNTKLLVAANGTVGYADVPIMRYAEMPLIAAEAEIALGKESQCGQLTSTICANALSNLATKHK